ncbi:hypothetical protein [Cohnella massiliensis]|uniref:hypothetical protein n=1 Tax=Cohnella massiliensis TaxID=1816691 RepID=UPI0009BC6860|nr:hypothetical protein [Cohnella massiliensis]
MNFISFLSLLALILLFESKYVSWTTIIFIGASFLILYKCFYLVQHFRQKKSAGAFLADAREGGNMSENLTDFHSVNRPPHGALNLGQACANEVRCRYMVEQLAVTQGYAGLRRVTQGYAGLRRVTQGYAGLRRVMQGYAGLCRVTQGYAGLRRAAQGYAGLRRAALGLAKLRWILSNQKPAFSRNSLSSLDFVQSGEAFSGISSETPVLVG